MAKRGRPSSYTKEIAERVCEGLADGNTLRKVCEPDDMPSRRSVLRWVTDDVDGFSLRYAGAREAGYAVMADDILEIADETGRDTITSDEGADRQNAEWIARSKLRVDTRKWLLSKALPKVYGDKITQEVTGKDGAPLVPIINLTGRPEPSSS